MPLESSFLYTREDGRQEFVHDKYREFFASRYFFRRINDRGIEYKDVYTLLVPHRTTEHKIETIDVLWFLVDRLSFDKLYELLDITAQVFYNEKIYKSLFGKLDRDKFLVTLSRGTALANYCLSHLGLLKNKDPVRSLREFYDKKHNKQ